MDNVECHYYFEEGRALFLSTGHPQKTYTQTGEINYVKSGQCGHEGGSIQGGSKK